MEDVSAMQTSVVAAVAGRGMNAVILFIWRVKHSTRENRRFCRTAVPAVGPTGILSVECMREHGGASSASPTCRGERRTRSYSAGASRARVNDRQDAAKDRQSITA